MSPTDLLYAPTHEWAHVTAENGQKVATIGISAFAVEQLTDLVYMELPAVGAKFSAGQEFGNVESVKAVSPLYAPVGGEVLAVNTELPDHLDILNQDPYGRGWIVKLKVTDESGLSQLLDYAAYQKQCAEHG
jgi:glycine cleavage system H protein